MLNTWTARRESWMSAATPAMLDNGRRTAWAGATGKWFWSADRRDPCGTVHGPYDSAELATAAADADVARPYSDRGTR